MKRTNSGINAGRGERALLVEIRKRAARSSGGGLRLGIGDDCALLAPRRGEEVAVTTDLSIAGRHFRLDWHPPEAVGHRALARGLSDLAAMGARPVAAFLSLGLPRELTIASGRRRSWVQRFLDGLLALAETHHTPLAGGDLAESPIVVADIVLVGAVPQGHALLRSGARPGDLLYVTGALGGAAAGLARLAELAQAQPDAPNPPFIPKKLKALLAPHLYPQPRIRQGLWLQRHGMASAALDLSDGLSTDLAHLCTASKVSAELELPALPIHSLAAALDDRAQFTALLHGGEDYELLFTAAPSTKIPRSIANVPITQIGRILAPRRNKPQMSILTGADRFELQPHGWEHLA